MVENKDFNMNDLVATPIEDLVIQFKKYNKGQLETLKTFLEVNYNKCSAIKEQLLVGISTNKIVYKAKVEAERQVTNLYAILKKIEDMCTIIEEIKKTR